MKLVPKNQSPYKVLRLWKEDRVTKRLFGKRHEIKKKSNPSERFYYHLRLWRSRRDPPRRLAVQ